MKLTLILAAVALALPATAGAQSVADTHELVWYPAGKIPAATYRSRDAQKCVKRFDHRAADKGGVWVKAQCPAVAKTSVAPVAAN